jgi:hypothetical protein
MIPYGMVAEQGVEQPVEYAEYDGTITMATLRL